MAENSVAQRRNRWSRGQELVEEGAFERISRTVFIVESPNGGVYLVKLSGYCECEDHKYHAHIEGFCCKHVIAARRYSEWLAKSARALAPMFDEVA